MGGSWAAAAAVGEPDVLFPLVLFLLPSRRIISVFHLIPFRRLSTPPLDLTYPLIGFQSPEIRSSKIHSRQHVSIGPGKEVSGQKTVLGINCVHGN